MEDKKIVCKDSEQNLLLVLQNKNSIKKKDLKMIQLDVNLAETQKKLEIIREVCKRWPLATFFFYKIFLN